MTTITPASGVAFASATALLAAHLADHDVSEPVALSVTTSYSDSTVTAQLRGDALAEVASDLLTWAHTLKRVTVEAWRPPERDRVHLSIHGTLTGPAGAVELKVFGCVDHDPLVFVNLQPDPCQGRSLSLGQLRSWAANPSTPMGTPVLEEPRAAR